MLTDPKRGYTPEKVRAELEELETTYKRLRRTKLAFLRALEAEAVETKPEDEVTDE
jgi:hypothetical protein